MKRKVIFTIGIFLFFSFVAVNCSAQSSTNDQRIVGTWVGTDSRGDTITYVFNANGSGTFTDSGDSSGTRTITYGLSIDGGIKIVGSYEGKIYFSPDGKTLIFSFTSTVFKKR